MQTLYDLVIFKSQNEHNPEHDLEHNLPYNTPKIYDADGDLSKRWYVYFSFRNPETGKLQRMKNIYGSANQYKTKASRYTALNLYKKRLMYYLNQGFSPFDDNTALYHAKEESTSTVNSEPKPTKVNEPTTPKIVASSDQEEIQSMLIDEAFEFFLKLKSNVITARSLSDYRLHCEALSKWLKTSHKDITRIHQVTRKHINMFLNMKQLKSSPRNRNNYRTTFSSVFQTLEDNDIIEKNVVKGIKAIKTQPKRNKTYSKKQQQEIFEYLEENDTLLLLYIKFISYNLLRPIEVNRLQIKDINIEQKTLQFRAKNKMLKTKIIPEILLKELPDLTKLNKNYFLFTPDGIGKKWSAELNNRRDYFSKRYKKVVKRHFKFDENYGLYSFRHTFITKLYKALVKDSSPFEAKSKLMLITGHSTMSALEKYLRDIDAELPADYSDLL